jgi:hypothetical protein
LFHIVRLIENEPACDVCVRCGYASDIPILLNNLYMEGEPYKKCAQQMLTQQQFLLLFHTFWLAGIKPSCTRRECTSNIPMLLSFTSI